MRALFLAALLATGAAFAELPADPHAIRQTISYTEMERFLAGLDGKGPIHVSVEAKTAEGRSVFLVHAVRGKAPTFRILFYAQQHGDEVSGKDALLFMLRDIAAHPERLPEDVDLYVFPMMNPDGAEAAKRRNAAGADLNRDHIVLEQPETQALHRVARRVRPHLAVDCHEFTRDGEERASRGWMAYPDITLDGLDNPLFDPALRAIAQRWVDGAAAPLAAAGHTFYRYTVGGLPPREEQRHSAPDVDSGLNAIGMYGGLSFIAEAAVKRSLTDEKDLASRVDAYGVLLWRFVDGGATRAADLAAVEKSRARALPAFIPANYLWVNPALTVSEFPVIELSTGKTLRIPTPNLMTEVAVKSAVPAPLGYAVEPRAAADFKLLFERHGIPFEELSAPRTIAAERCTLVRIEDEFDDVYSRYEGRQIVRYAPAAPLELAAGSLVVTLAGESAVRSALLLEPLAMYGVWQYPRFRKLATPGEVLPIVRVVK